MGQQMSAKIKANGDLRQLPLVCYLSGHSLDQAGLQYIENAFLKLSEQTAKQLKGVVYHEGLLSGYITRETLLCALCQCMHAHRFPSTP